MINNTMESSPEADNTPESPKKPDDSSGIYVRGFVKITDPESGEVIVETGN